MSETRLPNFTSDLQKAKNLGLLIEVMRSDLKSWTKEGSGTFREVCNASAAIFDENLSKGKTNVLMVCDGEARGSSSIFESLLFSLDGEFSDLHKRQLLKKLTGFGLNQAFAGGVGDVISDSLSVGAEKMLDYLAEWTGSTSDFFASTLEAGFEALADESGEIVGTIGATGAGSLTEQFSSDATIYLTPPARKRLQELLARLREKATAHETLQLALEILLVTAIGAPKVILVNDPLCLDDASLALLAMLVSVEKDLRQASQDSDAHQSGAQTTGISVVLTFTGVQPHDSVQKPATAEKQRVISRLRTMASRYCLLERLDADIPVPAVRATTFVGREEELGSLWLDWRDLCSHRARGSAQLWRLIKGEPGTGKTALANRFIQKIRSDAGNLANESTPILRILNQTGHSAQSTGLASLKNSIVDELRRLTLVYQENVGWFKRFGQQMTEGAQSWTQDARSESPEAKKRTRKRVGKVVSKLLGVDAAVELSRSAIEWSKHQDIRNARAMEFGQSWQASQKEEQFHILREALLEIRKLSHKCALPYSKEPSQSSFPFLLLVDDLQWVDDITAEFLLNEWPTDLPVYIIATARGSDSFTITKDGHTTVVTHPHREWLFKELNLIDPEIISVQKDDCVGKAEKQERQKNIYPARSLELKGMNQPMLANLIELTYLDISTEQSRQFANNLIKNLSSSESAADVVTLFAVETLNVISDPQLYRRNPALPHLIEPVSGSTRYRFAKNEDEQLGTTLDTIFNKLKETYWSSYQLDSNQSPGGARFSLASYAVLEERLHLIEQYFGEYGSTARYSLLISALIGSPFHSALVQHLLNDLKSLSPEENPDLAPFLRKVSSEVSGWLEPAQYELLEHTYEIIRRLEENTVKYTHQHSLLTQFLLSQLTRVLNRAWPEKGAFDRCLSEFLDATINSGKGWFNDQAQADIDYYPTKEAIEIDRWRFYVAVTYYGHQIMRSRHVHFGKWSHAYAICLSKLAIAIGNQGRPEEALPFAEEGVSLRRQAYESSPEEQGGDYAIELGNLATLLTNAGQREDGLRLSDESFKILYSLYESNPEIWSKDYAVSLQRLAGSLHAYAVRRGHGWGSGRQNELVIEALSIMRDGVEKSPQDWAASYLSCLSLYADMLILLGRDDETLELYQENLQLRRQGNGDSADLVEALLNVARVLNKLNRLEEAYPLIEEALKITWEGHEESPNTWAQLYSDTLCDAAGLFNEFGLSDQALEAIREALKVASQGHGADPGGGGMPYARLLEKATVHLWDLGLLEEALRCICDAVELARKEYESAPGRWAHTFFNCITTLKELQLQLGLKELPHQADSDQIDGLNLRDEVLKTHRECLSVARQGHEFSPGYWKGAYQINLDTLSKYLAQAGCLEEALELRYEHLSSLGHEYENAPADPLDKSDFYAQSLHMLTNCLEKLGRIEDALPWYNDALSHRRQRFETLLSKGEQENEDFDFDAYVDLMNDLALIMDKLGRPGDAVSLYRETMSIRKKICDLSLTSSRKDRVKKYILSVKSLADYLDKHDGPTEALYLYEQIMSTCLEWYKPMPTHTNPADYSGPELRRLLDWGPFLVDALLPWGENLENSDRQEEAVRVYEVVLPVLKTLSHLKRKRIDDTPSRFSALSRNLASLLEQLGCEKEALSIYADELATFRVLYEKTPERWIENLTTLMDVFSCKLKSLGHYSESAAMESEALSLGYKNLTNLREIFEEEREGGPHFLACLERQAERLIKMGRAEEAAILTREARSLHSNLKANSKVLYLDK